MNEKKETIKDILDGLLSKDSVEALAAIDSAETIRILLGYVASRIEAAAEWEREEAKNYFAELHDGPSMICTAKNCAVRNIGLSLAAAPRKFDEAAPGNAAEMRDALADLVGNIEIRAKAFDIFSIVDKKTWLDAKAALAAPARNCDRFQTELDAQFAFLNDVWLISVEKETMQERDKFENWTEQMKTCYGRWLLAPAKKGGAE